MPHRERLLADRLRLSNLFAAHGAEILAYARRRGASPADAEDVVAETFVVAWRRLDRLPDGAARGWLLAIARRVLANQRRGHVRRERRSASLPDSAAAPAAPTGLDADLKALLDQLRRADREILELVAWEGLTPAELAVTLGISANAAAIRLHRARRRFRDVLQVKGSRRSRTLGWVKGSLARRRREVEP